MEINKTISVKDNTVKTIKSQVKIDSNTMTKYRHCEKLYDAINKAFEEAGVGTRLLFNYGMTTYRTSKPYISAVPDGEELTIELKRIEDWYGIVFTVSSIDSSFELITE